MTRNTQTREVEKRPVVYNPPSELDVPKQLLKHFHDQGLKLRWIRFAVGNQTDERNLVTRRQEGWKWVTKQELPDEFKDFYGTTKIQQNNSVICQGDLILATIDAELSNARQRYYEDLSTRAVESTRQDARNNEGNSSMDRYVPILDEIEDPQVTAGMVKKT